MQSEYLFELGGENKQLAKYEALEVLKSEGCEPELNYENNIFVIFKLSKKLERHVVKRLGMTKRVSQVILNSSRKNLPDALREINKIDIGKSSFAIRRIGKNVAENKNNAVLIGDKVPSKNETELKNPDVKILFYIGSKIIISTFQSKTQTAYKKCLKHHVKHRPYFSPISIHPRIARSMINLSKCLPKSRIVDPFCGTGGILIEAADMGMKAVGIDISARMIENSIGNLKHFGFKGIIKEGDVKILETEKCDGIVTDPPYGISSSSNKERIDNLLERTIQIFSNCLESGQRAVIAVSNPKLIHSKNLRIIYQFEWYIHKSLTRHIIVLEKTSN